MGKLLSSIRYCLLPLPTTPTNISLLLTTIIIVLNPNLSFGQAEVVSAIDATTSPGSPSSDLGGGASQNDSTSGDNLNEFDSFYQVHPFTEEDWRYCDDLQSEINTCFEANFRHPLPHKLMGRVLLEQSTDSLITYCIGFFKFRRCLEQARVTWDGICEAQILIDSFIQYNSIACLARNYPWFETNLDCLKKVAMGPTPSQCPRPAVVSNATNSPDSDTQPTQWLARKRSFGQVDTSTALGRHIAYCNFHQGYFNCFFPKMQTCSPKISRNMALNFWKQFVVLGTCRVI